MKNIVTDNTINPTTVVTKDKAKVVSYQSHQPVHVDLQNFRLLQRALAVVSKSYRCDLIAAYIATVIKKRVSSNAFIPYDFLESQNEASDRNTLRIENITKNHIAILSDCSKLPKKYMRPDNLSMVYTQGQDRVKETFLCNKGVAVVDASMYGKHAFKINTEVTFVIGKNDAEEVVSRVTTLLNRTAALCSENLVYRFTNTQEPGMTQVCFVSTLRFPDYANSWRPYLAYPVQGMTKEIMDLIEAFGKDHYCMRGDIHKRFYRCKGYFNIELTSPFETLVISSQQAYYGYAQDYGDVINECSLMAIYETMGKDIKLGPGFNLKIHKNNRVIHWVIIS